MVPTNPDNSQPLIYRILDSLGVAHLVAPVNHTHEQSEVTDLTTHLANKLAKLTSFTTGNFVKVKSDGTLEDSGKKASDFQSPLTFDSVPTENSTNPVTSGGVKAALDAKRQIRQDDPETSSHAIVTASAEEGDVYVSISVREDDVIKNVIINIGNIDNLARALTNPDSAPTANSDKLVPSGGIYNAINALYTDKIPIHQVTAILPKTSGEYSVYDQQSWLGSGKMAMVLQTARPVTVLVSAQGIDDSPDGTWSAWDEIEFDLAVGVRTVKNLYSLMYDKLHTEYPSAFIGNIIGWEISVQAKDTKDKDTACLINFYNPTSAE